ncbi:kinase-like domain-containing protein [Xylariaceae sp. FL1651]|nr:kinase-like domain-containing protein [Xylariaceae sp. FL1651]
MASNIELLDLVRDSKLEATFQGPNITIHPANCRMESHQAVWHRENPLGSGAYGIVWFESRNAPSPSLRAVKELKTYKKPQDGLDYRLELGALTKFSQREYRDYFVRFYGWYEKPETLCVALEYCALGDLRNYIIRERKALPETEAQEVASQVNQGLVYMHENDFAHRDLKPANILIQTCPPDEWRVKICDLGLSKRVGESDSTSSRGTHCYMPPEMLGIGGRRAQSTFLDMCVDMWSLGETVVYMLTAEASFPYPADLIGYSQDRSKMPLTHQRIVNESLSAYRFIRSCMAIEPKERCTAKQAAEHEWLEYMSSSENSTELSAGEETDLQPVLNDLGYRALEGLYVNYDASLPSGQWATTQTQQAVTEQQRRSATERQPYENTAERSFVPTSQPKQPTAISSASPDPTPHFRWVSGNPVNMYQTGMDWSSVNMQPTTTSSPEYESTMQHKTASLSRQGGTQEDIVEGCKRKA